LQVGGGAGPIHHFAGLWGQATAVATTASLHESWWPGIADVRDRIRSSPFVRGLLDGRLERSAYRWYLGQDALYLAGYADLLDRAAASAPTSDESTFWAEAARACREEELRLHRDELGDEVHALSPVTAAYLGHLRAAASHADHAVLIAAVLPCFWIYADIGAGRSPAPADHPYREWLEAYAAAAFHDSTRRAIGYVASAWNSADASTRSRAWDAFRASAEFEDAFFRAPLDRAG
jgi:thiaminase